MILFVSRSLVAGLYETVVRENKKELSMQLRICKSLKAIELFPKKQLQYDISPLLHN